jgi:hypothetical protein
MRRIEASGLIGRTLGLAVLCVGLGLVVTTGAARAEDNDGRTMSEKIKDGFYGMIRGTNMDNRGIDYRERSPLVVPPTLDLPPPSSAASQGQIANWPRDPDERQRRAVIAAKKKDAPPPARVRVTNGADPAQAPQPINIAPPVEEAPIPGTTRPAYASDRNGTALTDPVYDKPGDLFTGGAAALSDWTGVNLFGSKKTVQIEPGTEPARTALTQPPAGYQTPAAGYDYGEEKKGWLDGQSNPDRNPLAQRSSASSVTH